MKIINAMSAKKTHKRSVQILLFDFFAKLHQAGVPLGMTAYAELLRVLQGGFGHDVESLKRVCRALWISTAEEEYIFNDQFSLIEDELRWQLNQLKVETEKSVNTSEPKQSFQETSRPESSEDPSQPKPASDTLSSKTSKQNPSPERRYPGRAEPEPSEPHPLEEHSKDEQNVSMFQFESYDIEFPCTNCFPITKRQMKQNWRYLRRFVRTGRRQVLDIRATVEEIGRQGFFLEPVMIPLRKNRQSLFMLIDQDGSMVPFHVFSERLKNTAIRGGRLEKTRVYYFHDCPAAWLYRDQGLIEAEVIDGLLSQLRAEETNVLIISDAGAARGGFSSERLELTQNFLTRLRSYVPRIVWLNPMPRSRWLGTTAGEIEALVPMFEMSRQGLDHAISQLRRYS